MTMHAHVCCRCGECGRFARTDCAGVPVCDWCNAGQVQHCACDGKSCRGYAVVPDGEDSGLCDACQGRGHQDAVDGILYG